jgi:hypothetical protein
MIRSQHRSGEQNEKIKSDQEDGWTGFERFDVLNPNRWTLGIATAGAMKLADELEPRAAIGPLIDTKAVEKVEARIADPVKKRAQGGDRWHPPRWAHLCEPTADSERQRGSSRNVVGRISARTIDCA